MSDKIKNDKDHRDKLIEGIRVNLQESYLEDPNYKTNSTNSDEINKLITQIV